MKRSMRVIGVILAVVVLSLLVYLAAVLMTIGEKKDYKPYANESGMTETGRVVRDTTVTALADAFGAEVPVFPEREIISGVTGNAVHAGRDCRTLSLTFDNGFTVEAVRPASAAPLLHADGMEVVMLREVSACNLPA